MYKLYTYGISRFWCIDYVHLISRLLFPMIVYNYVNNLSPIFQKVLNSYMLLSYNSQYLFQFRKLLSIKLLTTAKLS